MCENKKKKLHKFCHLYYKYGVPDFLCTFSMLYSGKKFLIETQL